LPSAHNRESNDEPACKISNVYFNRENRSNGDDGVNLNSRSSRDLSRNRNYDDRMIDLTANLATEQATVQQSNDVTAWKRSRSQSVHNRGSNNEPAYKKSNVYFNRDNRSNGDGGNRSSRSSRDRSKNRSYDGRGRSNDRFNNQNRPPRQPYEPTHYAPRSSVSNTKVPLPQSTNPALTYEITPDGVIGWYLKGLQLKYTGSYEEVLDKCLGTISSGNPSKEPWGDRLDDKIRRSNSIDARKIDD